MGEGEHGGAGHAMFENKQQIRIRRLPVDRRNQAELSFPEVAGLGLQELRRRAIPSSLVAVTLRAVTPIETGPLRQRFFLGSCRTLRQGLRLPPVEHADAGDNQAAQYDESQ